MKSLAPRAINRLRQTRLAGRARALRTLVTPTAHAEAAATALPIRYRWLRIATVGQAPSPIDRWVVHDLLGGGRPSRLPFDLVVVAGGTELTGKVVDALVECEQTSTRTVLIATSAGDVESELAAVCTDVASADAAVVAAARPRVGADRTHQLPADPDDSFAWLDALTSLR